MYDSNISGKIEGQTINGKKVVEEYFSLAVRHFKYIDNWFFIHFLNKDF